ncbi:hypothetical protein ACQ4PT_029641 [Festuca glaucescens]
MLRFALALYPLRAVWSEDNARSVLCGLRYAAAPVNEFPNPDSNYDVDDLFNFDVSGSDVANFLDLCTEGNSVGSPKKRQRSKPVGGSNAWGSFTKIYTKVPDVVYAACHHCGRMMKLKGGAKCGTKSLLRHIDTCPCKPGNSVDTRQ